MARPRQDLQLILEEALGSTNVYFQPPETVKLKYPCIVYELNDSMTLYADNKPYLDYYRYTLTVIDKNPDSEVQKRVKALPYCSFDSFSAVDNLNHYYFTLYF